LFFGIFPGDISISPSSILAEAMAFLGCLEFLCETILFFYQGQRPLILEISLPLKNPLYCMVVL
jgi:hypothetical protein